ncbi:hypothetical protein StoSoilA2_33790 [Arthrobacter sp. StoSoilA2]|uniref:hypothetical protein n=1 Tax=Arthrobacter sp. StoSoilA2 TaxID=2830990 RepID=UPI001CC6D252|nr:hypothetical protein [Arthrobacter sp. StoSoilA2]BCW37323.1 hypothetical protein StoSoilA2_33790 [Arthrobacter sp. StoSoilA2]
MADESPSTPADVDPTVTGAVTGATTWVPEAMPSDPLVVAPEVPAGALPPEVPAVLADESPSTPADVEPTVTGAVTGATIWVPEATPSDPLVLDPDVVPVPEVPDEVPAVLADESPSTPAEVEPTVTGAVTGATTWVPEAMPSDPLVLDPDVEPVPEVPDEEPAPVAEESPSTPADVEPTVTGAVTGATTWVPEATPSEPLVLDPDVVPVPEVPDDVPAVLAEESPSTPAEVEPTVTGAITGATTWVPEATPSEPLVVAPGVAAGAPPVFEGAPDVAEESPPTPAAVAPMLTGTNIGATT